MPAGNGHMRVADSTMASLFLRAWLIRSVFLSLCRFLPTTMPPCPSHVYRMSFTNIVDSSVHTLALLADNRSNLETRFEHYTSMDEICGECRRLCRANSSPTPGSFNGSREPLIKPDLDVRHNWFKFWID